jgi:hypothetical protein
VVKSPGRGDTNQCALAGRAGPEKGVPKHRRRCIPVSSGALPGRVDHGNPHPVISSPASILCPSGQSLAKSASPRATLFSHPKGRPGLRTGADVGIKLPVLFHDPIFLSPMCAIESVCSGSLFSSAPACWPPRLRRSVNTG